MYIELRNILEPDIPAIRIIVIKIILRHYTKFKSENEIINKLNDLEDMYSTDFNFPGTYYVGAFHNNILIGFISCYMQNNKPYIDEVNIDPDFQNKGVGTILINGAIAFYRNKFTSIVLDVDSRNYSAYFLYKKLDFIEINNDVEKNNITMEKVFSEYGFNVNLHDETKDITPYL